MTTGNHYGPTVVFESHGFAVAHVTTLWRSHYEIAAKTAHGEITVIVGGDNEPLSHLLAWFVPEILAGLECAIKKDKPLDGEPIDLDWELRRRDVAAVRARVDENARDPLYSPASYAEGESAWDAVSDQGRLILTTRVLTTN